MSIEEVAVGLKNALVRGQTIEKAMQSLILAGYDPKDVQEAVRQTNQGVIGNIGVVGETNNSPIPPQEFKKLPTENVQQIPAPSDWNTQQKPKKPIPKWLIFSLIGVGILILILTLLGIFGQMILNALKP